MYLKHFKLRDFAFSLSPNTDFYLNMASSREALKMVLMALKNGDGFVKITGAVGTGKTLLCRKVLHSLTEDFVPIYIANPALSDLDIYRSIAEHLGMPGSAAANGHQLSHWLNTRLMDMYHEGKKVVLLVDEAQALSDQALEAIRLLTNIETEKRKLMHILLFGQSELDERLNQPHLLQIKQRIIFSYRLEPLESAALRGYVSHRLGVAGYVGKELFTKEALQSLHRASAGIPRLINILSHKAMIIAYQQGKKLVTQQCVQAAAQDTESAFTGPLDPTHHVALWSGVGAALLGVFMTVVF